MKNLQARVTSKGQVTIPMLVRQKMAISTGSKLEFIMNNGCVMIVPVTKSVISMKAILPKLEKPLTCEDINQIIRTKHDRA